jgi:ribosomal-protein-alanine N-acetyltransferase
MLKPPKPYRLRSMRLSDITWVMAIEELIFPTPWKASAYEYEVSQNRLARYKVLTAQIRDTPERVIGYAGIWKLSDEAHISTLGVHPDWQGKGLGELLLLDIMWVSFNIGATLTTLEVRKGNKVAQALYEKYAFEVVGERSHYYQGKEDALIMTLEPLDRAYWVTLRAKQDRLFERLSKVTSP